jgi:thioredoxin reductase (NADPH)
MPKELPETGSNPSVSNPPAVSPAIPHSDEMFPTLTGVQIARLASFGHERELADGAEVWTPGDRGFPFYVVLSGGIAILGAADRLITTHSSGNFSGDVDMLTGRPAVVRGRARGATRVLEIPRDRLRGIVQTDPELSEILLRAFILRRLALVAQGQGSVVLVGSRHSAGTLALQEFLTRNNQPYAYLDVDRDSDVQKTLDEFAVGIDDVPVVICRGVQVLKKPSIEKLADCLGMNSLRDDAAAVRDVVIVGAGPAGLAAAVYAASEGLDALVLETSAPGGQAGSSSRIENYLGFPTGVTGQDLAGRAFVQAEKFGAEFAVTRTAARLLCERKPYRISVGGAAEVQARTVVIATGARYRKPPLPNLAHFEGVGIYYGATAVEAARCAGEDVIIVGGGNSAGQAAVFLASTGGRVTILVRGDGLAESMSRYLIRRIEETPNIELKTRTEIVELEGGDSLERVTWRDGATGKRTTVPIRHVFLMTGASPNTEWLEGCVAMDENRFVRTGPDLSAADLAASGWPLARAPLLFETSRPGVFAVGDVRSGSVKRVAAAVGEGSVCVQLLHKALAE